MEEFIAYNMLPVERTYKGKLFRFNIGFISTASLMLIVILSPLRSSIGFDILCIISFLFYVYESIKTMSKELQVTSLGLIEKSRFSKKDNFIRFEVITRIGRMPSYLDLEERLFVYGIESLDGNIVLNDYTDWKSLVEYIYPKVVKSKIAPCILRKIGID